MAVASLVLGIVAILFGVFGSGLQFVGAICGIVGIILAVKGKEEPDKAGIAKAGLVCSIIGTVLSLILFIACIACIGALGSIASIESFVNL